MDPVKALPTPRAMITRWRSQWTLLFLWALMSALSYPRPNLWILSYLSLVPLTLLALRGAPRWRVGLVVYLVATCWWGGMLWWIYPVTGPGFFALAAYQGLYAWAFVMLLPVVARRIPLPMMFWVPVLWVGLEWLRGDYMVTGFPWFLQGQSQPLFVIQIADIVGAYGVSFFVCVVNGFLADFLTRPLTERSPGVDEARLAKPLIVRFCLFSLMILLTVGYGVYRVRETNGIEVAVDREELRIAVVQTNVPQSNKVFPTDEQDAVNFVQMLGLSLQSIKSKPDLIVWPETMVPRAINNEYLDIVSDSHAYRELLDGFIDAHGKPMLVGVPAYEGWDDAQRRFMQRYNSVMLLRLGGGEQRYDKVHRVPFGEFIPGVEVWPWAKKLVLGLTPYDFDYTLTPGKEWTIFPLRVREQEWNLATPVCFEDVMPYVPREMVWGGSSGKRVDVLVNLSNDGWFAGTAEGPQHEQIARFRCVENRVPMARAVNTGISGFIDSAGRVYGRVESNGELQGVDGVQVRGVLRDGRVPVYAVVGEGLAMGCVFVSAAGCLLALIARFRHKFDMEKKT